MTNERTNGGTALLESAGIPGEMADCGYEGGGVGIPPLRAASGGDGGAQEDEAGTSDGGAGPEDEQEPYYGEESPEEPHYGEE